MKPKKHPKSLCEIIRYTRYNIPILKNMRLSGYTKEQCLVKFDTDFVNSNWDNLWKV